VKNWLSLLRSTWLLTASAHSREHFKNVGHATGTAAATPLVNTFFSIFVIDVSLFCVAQHLIGCADILELLRISTFVGMLLKS